MKKILIAICLVAMLLTLTACGDQQTQTTGKTFIGGVEGIKTTFLAGNPPDTTIDQGQSPFAIVVKVENIGESDIKANEGYIKILGLEPSQYNANTLKKNFPADVLGAQKNPDGSPRTGGTVTIEFGDLKYLPTIQGDLQQNIWADACYKYTTKIAAQLCIKKDAAQTIGNKKICEIEGEKNPQNSGAPIQITSLKESFAGNGKIALTLIISHAGKGDAFFKDTDSECNDVESNGNKGKVHIKFKSVNIGGRDVYPQCTGLTDSTSGYDGFVKLYKDGTGKETTTVYCTLDVSSSDTISEVPIQAELSYLYLQHIEKPITIRHVAK